MSGRPKIVVLVGSTRFRREFERAFRNEEHAGRICLTVPCYKDDPCCRTEADHQRLDALHRHKIDLADEVLVINCKRRHCCRCNQPCNLHNAVSECCWDQTEERAYIGSSTRKEIEYATSLGKPVRYLEGSPCPNN